MKRSIVILLTWLAAPALASAPRNLLFRRVRIFDGEHVSTGDVLVRDGKIAAVGAIAHAGPDVETIPGEGRTLLPGLIDSHTHAGDDPHTLEQALSLRSERTRRSLYTTVTAKGRATPAARGGSNGRSC
jgi:imidazolonepropionase-like amidohydrolase